MSGVWETLDTAGGTFLSFSGPMLIQISVLVVIVLLLDRVLRTRVRAAFRYGLWMLVIVKLMLPVSLSLP